MSRSCLCVSVSVCRHILLDTSHHNERPHLRSLRQRAPLDRPFSLLSACSARQMSYTPAASSNRSSLRGNLTFVLVWKVPSANVLGFLELKGSGRSRNKQREPVRELERTDSRAFYSSLSLWGFCSVSSVQTHTLLIKWEDVAGLTFV